jgi:hypothetical protein
VSSEGELNDPATRRNHLTHTRLVGEIIARFEKRGYKVSSDNLLTAEV